MRLLHRLPDLLKPGGQLFITTPFTWLEEYTPAANWLGDGARIRLPDYALPQSLSLVWMPIGICRFLIREHARKFQYSLAQASRWLRSDCLIASLVLPRLQVPIGEVVPVHLQQCFHLIGEPKLQVVGMNGNTQRLLAANLLYWSGVGSIDAGRLRAGKCRPRSR